MKKFFVMVALMLPLAVSAQEKKDTTIAVPQTENTMRVAAELSKHGYATKDALSLIQAARLSKQAGFTQDEKKKDGTEGTATADQGVKNGKVCLNRQTAHARLSHSSRWARYLDTDESVGEELPFLYHVGFSHATFPPVWHRR